jgi:hypothetical protein
MTNETKPVIIINDNVVNGDIDVDIFLGQDDAVYIKFSNFEDEVDAESYANYLAEILPLILYHSETKH